MSAKAAPAQERPGFDLGKVRCRGLAVKGYGFKGMLIPRSLTS